eukprot:tig00000147_g9493.t1
MDETDASDYSACKSLDLDLRVLRASAVHPASHAPLESARTPSPTLAKSNPPSSSRSGQKGDSTPAASKSPGRTPVSNSKQRRPKRLDLMFEEDPTDGIRADLGLWGVKFVGEYGPIQATVKAQSSGGDRSHLFEPPRVAREAIEAAVAPSTPARPRPGSLSKGSSPRPNVLETLLRIASHQPAESPRSASPSPPPRPSAPPPAPQPAQQLEPRAEAESPTDLPDDGMDLPAYALIGRGSGRRASGTIVALFQA